MSVNTELQALLTKMGGTPLESDSNSDLIKKISNAYEGGGSGSGVLVATDMNGTLDKTWQEIYDATFTIIKKDEDGVRGTYPVLAVDEDSGEYGVIAMAGVDRVIGYSSSSASGFPTSDSSGGGEE